MSKSFWKTLKIQTSVLIQMTQMRMMNQLQIFFPKSKTNMHLFLRGNQAPFINKELRKAIHDRSRLIKK